MTMTPPAAGSRTVALPGAPVRLHFEDPGPERVWADYHASGMPEIVGHFLLAHALFAFAASGMAATLRGGRAAGEAELQAGLDAHLAGHLLRYLEVHGVTRAADDGWRLTPRGELLTADVAQAQLGFYLESYGPVMQASAELLRGRLRYGDEVERDGEALGRHCATLFEVFHTPIVLRVMEGMGARNLLDLGCGGGRLLVDACLRNPELRGVGLDISPGAIEFARGLAERAGLSDRLSFVVADAFRPETWPEVCFQADALCAVGVLHEHFRDGEEAVIRILDRYAELIVERGLKGFILGEPVLLYDLEENDPDLYLIHIFTNQGFPRRHELWLELFERSRLRCRRLATRPNAGPRFGFYDLVPRGA